MIANWNLERWMDANVGVVEEFADFESDKFKVKPFNRSTSPYIGDAAAMVKLMLILLPSFKGKGDVIESCMERIAESKEVWI